MALLVATHAKHKLMLDVVNTRSDWHSISCHYLAKTHVLRRKRLPGLSALVQLSNQRLTIMGYDKGISNAHPLPPVHMPTPDLLVPVHKQKST
jgi:hypothetical protein